MYNGDMNSYLFENLQKMHEAENNKRDTVKESIDTDFIEESPTLDELGYDGEVYDVIRDDLSDALNEDSSMIYCITKQDGKQAIKLINDLKKWKTIKTITDKEYGEITIEIKQNDNGLLVGYDKIPMSTPDDIVITTDAIWIPQDTVNNL